MNTRLLRSQLVMHDLTIPMFAAKMGVTKKTMYKKFSGESEFTQSEIVKAIKVLELTEDMVMNIFFGYEVS